MASLTGAEALAFYAQIKHSNLARRTDGLAREKAAAVARHKEVFDLEKLAALCDLTLAGTRLVNTDAVKDGEQHAQRADWEYQYYVEHHDLLTLAAFAVRIELLAVWS